MARSTVVPRKKIIFQLLTEDKVRRIILFGDAGVGKTWTARQVANLGTKSGKIDIALWVFLNREYDEEVLRNSIFDQLALFSITGLPDSENNRHQISASLEGKKLLLVLDDERKKMNEQQIIEKLETLLNLRQQNYKILITTGEDPGSDAEDSRLIKVECLSGIAEAKDLLRKKVGPVVYGVPGIEDLAKKFIGMTRNLPAAIILMAKAIRYFGQQNSVQKLRHYLEETPGNEIYDMRQLLRCGYDLLPNEILIDCYWSGHHFFQVRQRVHYNELIAYWMMEGYLGCINSMEKAYERGHQILLELIDCRILREVEVDYVMMDETQNLDDVAMERATMNSDDCYRRGYGGTANLGLANVFGDRNWKGLGRLTLKDGAMEAFFVDKQEKLRTLLFDGNSLGTEFVANFLQSHQELEVLALLNPTPSIYHSLCTMHVLSVLVLRCCHCLEEIDRLGDLEFKNLTVLEISGPSSIRKFPGDFFKNMPRLQSLNLSFLQIKSLPSSVYELSELSWLILRECSYLEKIESLTTCRKLMVLDLSGAKSLALISDKKFSGFKELQVLNLSETKVAKLPLLKDLQKLTHLSLRGCLMLNRLCGINTVTSLQVLDLSSAGRFREFHDQSLADVKSLKIVDLSATPIKNLPANIGSPRHLYLKGCRELENLECIQTLKDLETLDLSDCTSLKELHAKSFEHMSSLRRLDLSGTKITVVPDLSKLCNLRHLLLKNCSDLSDVPQLGSLTKLVELNLRGIRSLERADFVEQMNQLQILDLSGTQLKQLPSSSRLKNLNELYLRDCPCLKEVPDWLRNLMVMDLPATKISHLPNMKNQGASSSNMEEPNQCGWGISVLPVAIVDGNDKPSTYYGSQFQQLVKGNPSLWQKDYEQFYFVVHPIEVQDRKVIVSLWRDDFVFRDTYLRTKYFYDFQMRRSTEIHGFHDFPEGLEDVLHHTDSLFLVDNVLKSLLSNLGASKLEQLKGCWIERCREMECVFREQEEGEIMKLENLEVLWVSNTGNLEHVFCGNWQTGNFQNLKHLYLDCCPKLSTIFSSAQVPTNLQVLHIKFCDKLEAVLKQESAEYKFPNLESLHLWELPKLKTIGCPLRSSTAKIIWACPKLETFRENVKLIDCMDFQFR